MPKKKRKNGNDLSKYSYKLHIYIAPKQMIKDKKRNN